MTRVSRTPSHPQRPGSDSGEGGPSLDAATRSPTNEDLKCTHQTLGHPSLILVIFPDPAQAQTQPLRRHYLDKRKAVSPARIGLMTVLEYGKSIWVERFG